MYSFLLVRHPKTLSRLKEEIQSIMGNEKHLTKSLIQRMPFLKCVLNESQ